VALLTPMLDDPEEEVREAVRRRISGIIDNEETS